MQILNMVTGEHLFLDSFSLDKIDEIFVGALPNHFQKVCCGFHLNGYFSQLGTEAAVKS